MGGVVSAEHGVGKLKRGFMRIMFQQQEIDAMMSTKRESILTEYFTGNIFSKYTFIH